MATVRKLGPADHGRKVAAEELRTAEYQGGYKYELIEGKLYVSPEPNLPEDRVEKWLFGELFLYSRTHREVITYLTDKARVFIPDREDLTVPEPDLAAYRDFPVALPFREVPWEEVSPFLVVEILSREDPDKDLVAQPRSLFARASNPRILDHRHERRPRSAHHDRLSPARPALCLPMTILFGGTYTTRLLPGFELVLNPRA